MTTPQKHHQLIAPEDLHIGEVHAAIVRDDLPDILVPVVCEIEPVAHPQFTDLIDMSELLIHAAKLTISAQCTCAWSCLTLNPYRGLG